MEILAIGCLHGKIPKNLKKILRKEKPDLILGSGDYAGLQLSIPMQELEERTIEKYGTRFSLWPKKEQIKYLRI